MNTTSTAAALHPDPQTEAARLCGVTTLVGGNEFICVAKAHGSPKSDQRDPHGRPSKWRRHYMVRRYPYRDMGATSPGRGTES